MDRLQNEDERSALERQLREVRLRALHKCGNCHISSKLGLSASFYSFMQRIG